jgi:DNA invertase Pin-like site-specific DNA recombinase
MRIIFIISLIAAFALATVVCVCADVITSKSVVAEATSLQSRRLRSEVNIFRIRRPVDGSISSDDESNSAEPLASADVDQSPPIRKRKHIPLDVEYASGILVNLKNAGNGDATTSSAGSRPNREKEKGQQLNLNMNNAEETADVPSAPRKTFKRSTDQVRQDITLFLHQRMKADGSLPLGTNSEAASRFGRSHSTISRIYKELKPKSAYERVIPDQERQDIVSFLRHRMNSEGSLHYGTIAVAARHFDRHRSIIYRIYKKIKPKSANERSITEEERQDIVLFLRQRMNSEGSLHYGTINDAIKHFGENRKTIERIYNEVKSVNERGITDQEQNDIMLFLRQRMNTEGLLQYGAIRKAAQHFGRHKNTISRIHNKMISNISIERGALIDEKTIVPT